MLKFLVGVIAIWFLTVQTTYAYLDGGTGGMLLQLLLGGVAGGFVIIKMYWHKFISFFKKAKD